MWFFGRSASWLNRAFPEARDEKQPPNEFPRAISNNIQACIDYFAWSKYEDLVAFSAGSANVNEVNQGAGGETDKLLVSLAAKHDDNLATHKINLALYAPGSAIAVAISPSVDIADQMWITTDRPILVPKDATVAVLSADLTGAGNTLYLQGLWVPLPPGEYMPAV